MDFSNFEYHKNRVPKDYEACGKYFEALQETFKKEIEGSENAKAYLKQFDPNSTDHL
ncbi:MAG: hypothetical protein HC830_06615 [Bacteroidetes bacterium]|nr:hypothetical protein [Bacteroidota bacterium]